MSHQSVITTKVSPIVYSSSPSESSVTKVPLSEPSLAPIAQKIQSPLPSPPLPKETKFQSKTTLDPEIYNWHPTDLTLDAKLLNSEFLKNLQNYLKQDSQEKLKDTKDLDAKTAVKLVTLDDLNAPGEYYYLAARKIAQCQFKETSQELQTALADYQNPKFVFQDPMQKQKTIAILCKYATNTTAAKALQRLHLVRSDIKYSIEVEVKPQVDKGKRVYDFYGPKPEKQALQPDALKEAGILDKLLDYLTPEAQKKCDRIELSNKFIEQNLTWFDLSQEGRALYTRETWPEDGELIAYSDLLPSFRRELYWENKGFVCELKTNTYYVSLDQLFFALRELISIFGTSGSYNIHISENCFHLRKSGDAKQRGQAMLNVLYGLNFLAMLEHTSKKYFQRPTRAPYPLEGLKYLEDEFTSARFFGDKPIDKGDWINIKCHHIAVVPGAKIYQAKDVLGFEVRSNNRQENDTTLLLSLLNNAAALGDIFAADAWQKIAMPKYSEIFLPAKQSVYQGSCIPLFVETPQAKKLGLTEENLIDFFRMHDGRIALPLVPWEKLPFFPQENALAKERLNEARERAIQELVERAKKKATYFKTNALDDAIIEAPVKAFVEILKEITAPSRQQFRHKIAEMALEGF